MKFDDDERILWRPRGAPRLKRFYTEVLAAALSRIREGVTDAVVPVGPALRISVELILREAMRDVARRVALFPTELFSLEWRDLERILREVFEGLGFGTELTRSSQDGGFDLALSCRVDERELTYLVEVKHWKTSKPGRRIYSDFVDVVVSNGASKGLLISTSGFGSKLLHGRVEVDRQLVRLGAADKVVELCQLYVRKEFGLWEQGLMLPTLLWNGTN
ncbi:restriction endonuclease [Micromonospora vulcania]|uniref:Restriction endonuclease n=1 Tax=Micromonospora vulcania TaxID=1441873 RepID=A0ABW1H783_9ACTN